MSMAQSRITGVDDLAVMPSAVAMSSLASSAGMTCALTPSPNQPEKKRPNSLAHAVVAPLSSSQARNTPSNERVAAPDLQNFP
jgi:hypothetical protein